MTDWTLGPSLTDPMVPTDPDSNPSILAWDTERWALQWTYAGQSAFAFVQIFAFHTEAPEGHPWMAYCAGPPDGVVMDGWHESAEAARAAVETHIAAHIEVTE